MTRKQLIILHIALSFISNARAGDWVLMNESDGIRSYRTDQPAEFKAITTLNCRLDVIAIILRDFAAYSRWMPDCLEARLIDQNSDTQLQLYYRHHAPWPFKNRDAVLRISTRLDTARKTLFIRTRNIDDERFPPADSCVRMVRMEADWMIQYLNGNQTRIEYRLLTDPGGYIPLQQAEQFMSDLPHETLVGLKRMINNPEYHKKAESSQEKELIEKYFEK
ncbi:MAG: START domain-containing protein [Fidelibacterota bacterium]